MSIRNNPKINQYNKNHMELVWGTEYEKSISIPRAIDDYNHWMLGIDR